MRQQITRGQFQAMPQLFQFWSSVVADLVVSAMLRVAVRVATSLHPEFQ
jgi:hypothetical protein